MTDRLRKGDARRGAALAKQMLELSFAFGREYAACHQQIDEQRCAHFFSRLVNRRGPDAGQAHLDDLYAHIDHIARVAGMHTVALGPDWFPFHPFGGWTRESGFSFVEGLGSIDCLPNLTRGLLEHGYHEADVEAILGGNFLRVLRGVLPSD